MVRVGWACVRPGGRVLTHFLFLLLTSCAVPSLWPVGFRQDIHVPRFTINYGSNMLIEDGLIKFVKGHRYGLVGRNGAGTCLGPKTLLFRA